MFANNMKTHVESVICTTMAILTRISGTESTQIPPFFPQISYDFGGKEPRRVLRAMARGPFWSLSPTRTITDSGILMDE